MPLIRAGDGDDVDERAGVETVAGGKRVGFDRELAECVGEGIGQVGVGEGIGVAAAVEDVVVVDALAAGDRDNGSVGVGFAAVNVVAGSIDGTTSDENELGGLTSVEWELGDALLVLRSRVPW